VALAESAQIRPLARDRRVIVIVQRFRRRSGNSCGSMLVQRCSLRPGLSFGKTRFATKVPTMAMTASMIWSFGRVD
jgi:hypothetical protein